MKNVNVDKATLKAAIKEMLLEDKSILKEVVKEILDEHFTKAKEENLNKEERLEKLNKIIDKDFEEYDAVFRALAKK